MQFSTLSWDRRLAAMQGCVRCLVEIPSITFVFLDVRVDVAPLLAVATEIRERHAKEWVDRLVMKLLCETRLACRLPWNDGQAVRELLRERGIATDASHYYDCTPFNCIWGGRYFAGLIGICSHQPTGTCMICLRKACHGSTACERDGPEDCA